MSFVLDALKKADRERDSVDDKTKLVEVDEFLSPSQSPKNNRLKSLNFYPLMFVFFFFVFFLVSHFNDKNVDTKLVKINKNQELTTSVEHNESKPIVVDEFVDVNKSTELENLKSKSQTELSFNITGHIFLGHNNSANKVFIDEQVYRIGSLLPGGFNLVSVSINELMLEKDQEKFIFYY